MLVHGEAEVGVEASLRSVAARVWREERALALVGLANLAAIPVFLLLMPFDGRTVLGLDVWVKPTKFAASVGIYVLTFALLLLPVREGIAKACVRWGTAIPLLFENGIIFAQAARGVQSHFNVATPLDAALFRTMGVLIGIVVLAALLLFVLYLVPRAAAVALPMRLAIVLGLALSLFGGAVGGQMIARDQHTVGAEDGGEGLPFLSWSTTAGDLRPAHFLALHALQALPLVAFALTGAPTRRATILVLLAATGYAALVVSLFALALAERPLLAI